MSFRMSAEWAPHARTLIGWPCRASSWGETLEQGRFEFAAVCNALVQFEPVPPDPRACWDRGGRFSLNVRVRGRRALLHRALTEFLRRQRRGFDAASGC